jgi:Kef-type K+ transport system membrane component KefB
VNTRIFVSTIIENINMVLLVVLGLIFSKFFAAWIAGKSFKFGQQDTLLMWSLSIPQVAATLAATMVAYNAINADGVRLLSEPMLNTVVVLVVVTSILGPILTRKFAARMQAQS